jgi:hypothetical protein
MSPEDRERLQNNQRTIERILERNRSAIEMADWKCAKYRRTLATSGAEIKSALSTLRRRGYLK